MRLMSHGAASHRSGLIRAAPLQRPNTLHWETTSTPWLQLLKGQRRKRWERDRWIKPNNNPSQNLVCFCCYGLSFKNVAVLPVSGLCVLWMCVKQNSTLWASTHWMNRLKRLLFVVRFWPSEPKDTKGGTKNTCNWKWETEGCLY